MARKALTAGRSLNFDGTGTGATVETAATKINDTLSDLDKVLAVLPLAANATSRGYGVKHDARTVTGFRARRMTALATGTFTLAVQDGDGVTLLSAATVDATTLTASFTALALTATPALLGLLAGECWTAALVSDNAGATGGPVIVEATYAAS